MRGSSSSPGLMAVPYDELKRRERARRIRRRIQWSLAGAAFALVLAVTAVWVSLAKQNQLLVQQSGQLAQESQTAIGHDDYTLAMLLALAALPRNLGHPNRPFVTAAEAALETAYANHRELKILDAHSGPVDSAAFSPDGTRIVTVSYGGAARLWDTHTGALLSVLGERQFSINSAVFSPDSTRIVTASDDGTARVWNAHTGVQLAVLHGHTNVVLSAAFSPTAPAS